MCESYFWSSGVHVQLFTSTLFSYGSIYEHCSLPLSILLSSSTSKSHYHSFVANQSFGNKFFENTEEDEIHLRTRWVQYKQHYYDMSQIEPAWHGWLGYLVDTPPNQTPMENLSVRSYPLATQRFLNFTGTRGAYTPYNTTKPKVAVWEPKVNERSG